MGKKRTKSRNMSVYSNLVRRRKVKKDASARKKAEYLASLPKHPVKRFFYRMSPKRFFKFWFSKEGAALALKISGVAILVMALLVGALFAYYRRELDAIRPGEIAKRVQTTVTKYYDRNDKLLWEDHGDGDYKLVVDSSEINDEIKLATIAIEDREFYNHSGVSLSGIIRSAINNARGNEIQGGSTLTQQLVKQVFFADEAGNRGLGGIPRKIKEVILAIEVERMYDKEQILTLYLNESPYGGRRNGVQSGAQTYFGKNAKELTLAEAALLAAIPNQPGLYNPYNTAGHDALIRRQHRVLSAMVETGKITQEEADRAKKVAILDSIRPESDLYKDLKAPHFVQMVRSELQKELGEATVGRGGLIVKTTLDLRIQNKLEGSVNNMFSSGSPEANGFTNGAATVEDVKTGNVIAMVGSRDFNYPGYGQDNAAIAYIQPGSSIKPLVYAELLKDRGEAEQNFGSGTIIPDRNIDNIYGAPLRNADRRFLGNITLRDGLALSRNIPAVTAMNTTGIKPAIETIHELGNKSYCTQGVDTTVQLSAAIGGCGARQVEHVNAFGTLARMGVYKPYSSVLEVKNNQGEVLQKWEDDAKRVIDEQIPYIISDILADSNARAGLFGRNVPGFDIPGVRTATKTGTSDVDGKPKDLWMMSYSPAIAMGVWLGNSDTRPLSSGNSTLPGPIIHDVMSFAHTEIYMAEEKWQPGDWFQQPEGIQVIGGELYPSWYRRDQDDLNAKLTFDKVSKKIATDCTPPGAREEIAVRKNIDPITKRDIYIAPAGYNANEEDDVHKCSDTKPRINSITTSHVSGNTYSITVSIRQGTHKLENLEIKSGSTVIGNIPVSSSGNHSATHVFDGRGRQSITASVRDTAYYVGESSTSFTPRPDSSRDDDD